MFNWVAKLAGKFAAKRMKLEDGPMDTTKPWYKSKTVLSGIVAVLIGGYNAASQHFGLPPIPDWVFAILGGIGVYGRVTAEKQIG